MYVFIWVEEQKKQTVIKKTKQTEETSMQKAKQTQLWCLVSVQLFLNTCITKLSVTIKLDNKHIIKFKGNRFFILFLFF